LGLKHRWCVNRWYRPRTGYGSNDHIPFRNKFLGVGSDSAIHWGRRGEWFGKPFISEKLSRKYSQAAGGQEINIDCHPTRHKELKGNAIWVSRTSFHAETEIYAAGKELNPD